MSGVIISPVAKRDPHEASVWYEARETGLGDRFLREAAEVMLTLPLRAATHRLCPGNFRRVNLPTFPYGVWCEIEADTVIIFGLLHGARHPARASSRARRFRPTRD